MNSGGKKVSVLPRWAPSMRKFLKKENNVQMNFIINKKN